MILAYSHCIAHGYNMQYGWTAAVQGGALRPLAADPLQSGGAAVGRKPVRPRFAAADDEAADYTDNELRYRMLRHTNPKQADRLMQMAQAAVDRKWKLYEEMATLA